VLPPWRPSLAILLLVQLIHPLVALSIVLTIMDEETFRNLYFLTMMIMLNHIHLNLILDAVKSLLLILHVSID
jgi:hypothetical protein